MINAINSYLVSQGGKPLQFGSKLYFDIECYPNYLLFKFMTVDNKYLDIEFFSENLNETINPYQLGYIATNFLLVGFNSLRYDIPIIEHVLSGRASLSSVKALSNELIDNEQMKFNLTKKFSFNDKIVIDHYDIRPVVPEPRPMSLKMFGARMFTPDLRDLPYDPYLKITVEQAREVNYYCGLDLINTQMLDDTLKLDVDVRIHMGARYGLDLRSKSNPQVGEAVMVNLLEKDLGRVLPKPKPRNNEKFRYSPPSFIKFQTPLMNHVLNVVSNVEFYTNHKGEPCVPDEVLGLDIRMGVTKYTLQIGGLHSNEKSQVYICDEFHRMKDVDADSFYPKIKINNGYYPTHVGERYLTVFENDLVLPRIHDKKAGKDKSLPEEVRTEHAKRSEGGKIVINGLYGKEGSPFCKLYAPDKMVFVCLAGQLSLLMLAERLELAGISVISANTDGIVMYYHKDLEEIRTNIVNQWEKDCNLTTETTNYKALYSMNVNNYIAVKTDDDFKETTGVKRKGLLADHWFREKTIFALKNTPDFIVCRNAVTDYLVDGVPIEESIDNCNDIRHYLSIRNVSGGGEFRGQPFGRVARFYISKNSKDCLKYIGSGNKVPKSDNAMLCMKLPDTFPQDVDKQFYVDYSYKILEDLGYLKPQSQLAMF